MIFNLTYQIADPLIWTSLCAARSPQAICGYMGINAQIAKDMHASIVQDAGGSFISLVVEILGLWTPFFQEISPEDCRSNHHFQKAQPA